MINTQAAVRESFWQTYYPAGKPGKFRGKRQNDLPADVRQAFVQHVDDLARDGDISEALAARVTL